MTVTWIHIWDWCPVEWCALVMQTALQKKDMRLMCVTYGQTWIQHIGSSPRPAAHVCWYRSVSRGLLVREGPTHKKSSFVRLANFCIVL